MDTTRAGNTSFMEYLHRAADASLTYIDNNDFTVTVVNVDIHCCRPLKVKCEEINKKEERCIIKKGMGTI